MKTSKEKKDKKLIKDDEFLLTKEREEKQLKDLKINEDYTDTTGIYFQG